GREDSAEADALDMLYRERLEFAVGHGVSVHAEVDDTKRCAYSVATRVIPRGEVPQATSPTEADFPLLAGLELEMKSLGGAAQRDLRAKLEPLVRAYEQWIRERDAEAQSAQLASHRDATRAAVDRCRATLERLRDGIALLETDSRAAQAFTFA